jgi:Flp pilus assembly protein TadG
MRNGAKRFVRGTRGQSMVEFALILPMMLVVMFMITEFGRALFQYNLLTTATREGCRQGVVAGSGNFTAAATAAADSVLLAGHIPLNTVSLTVTEDDNFNGTGTHVLKVTADKTFNWAFQKPITMTGGAAVGPPATALKLHAETYMHAETF